MTPRVAAIGAALWLAAVTHASASVSEEAPIPPASQRFAAEDVQEVPDFQRHLLPLMGRLGCNTRACHGSFQGQGGFRLSLFGYDFKIGPRRPPEARQPPRRSRDPRGEQDPPEAHAGHPAQGGQADGG